MRTSYASTGVSRKASQDLCGRRYGIRDESGTVRLGTAASLLNLADIVARAIHGLTLPERTRLDPTNSEEYAELVAYNLDASATVVIVGGYKGVTAATVSELYGGPRVLAFEPQRWAWDELRIATKDFPHVECFNFGLGVEDQDDVPMGEYHTDACSFLELPGQREFGTGHIRDAVKTLAGIDVIDLMLLNIEGYEYVLLPYLIEHGVMRRVRYLLIQWHRDYAEAAGHGLLLRALGETHILRETGAFDSYERR